MSAWRRAVLLVVAVLVGVSAYPLAAGASGYCPAYYSFTQCFGGASQGYGYGSSSGWYQFGSSSAAVPPGYGTSPAAACHAYFGYGTSRTDLFCGPVGVYRPVPPPPPPTGGGGGAPAAPADDVDRILGAAIRMTRDALAISRYNRYITGTAPVDDDAAIVFDNVQRGGRLRDTLAAGEDPGDHWAFAKVDRVGAGSSGTITLNLSFYAALNDPRLYNATMSTFSPPLTADEFRTMIVLHEVAHLTGANRHRDDAESNGFNYGIVFNCLR